MDALQNTQIIDLLRRREAEFVRVWKCEQAVIGILGMPDYPFAPPPDLPSLHNTERKAVERQRKRAAASPKAELPVRSLNDAENAYRIVYVCRGRQGVSFQRDRELVASLVATISEDFAVKSVETVLFVNLDKWKKVDTVWTPGRRSS